MPEQVAAGIAPSRAPTTSPTDVWHALPAGEVLERTGTSLHGLTEPEAAERLRRFGPNALRAAKPVSAWKILLDQLRSVVVMLLLAATAVALAMGDRVEATAVLVVLLLNTLLGFLTEMRARRAMEALLRMEAPHAVVVRDGRAREVEAVDVVPGDVIRVEAGQAVPCDARLLETTELRVAEAALTGESVPVEKRASAVLAPDIPLPDRENLIYRGTTVTAGSGLAVAVATGMGTELGRIGGLVASIEEEQTPLERRLDALGRRLVWLSLGVGAVVVVAGVVRGLPLGAMLESGIALAIAAVPEGLPAVATITLAVGMRRMVRRHALVRRLPAVETLGSVSVVCTDKTGTLTAGEMTVTTLRVGGAEVEVTGRGYTPEGELLREGMPLEPLEGELVGRALRVGMLANRAALERTDEGWRIRGDPTEAALLVAGRKAGLDRERLAVDWPEVGEVPFSSERRLMATFHRTASGRLIACVKGAPGRTLELCSRVLGAHGEEPLDGAGRDAIQTVNQAMGARGLRVLALATGMVSEPVEPALRDLVFLGLVGMIDPAAEGVESTIRALGGAGIRTVMITGDQRATAEAIARDLKILREGDEVLGGREFERLSDSDLARRVERVGAFSRVSPEAKLRIVSALKANGEITAMLGDGVNDAAALKRADVGVAMGIRGTDVAKEAAALVLQDDRFSTIAAAVEEGRVIFDNIRKFVFYLFSCNLAEVAVLLLAALVGLPLPLLPLQVLWLNLVTDTFPALALALEPAEADIMRRPPRDPQKAILSRGFLTAIAFYALLITVSTMAAFLWGLSRGPQERASTLAFQTLALAQAFHLGNARSPAAVVRLARVRANPWALGAVALVVGLQILAVQYPPLARTLGVVPLTATEWMVVGALTALPALVGQSVKGLRRRRTGVELGRAGV